MVFHNVACTVKTRLSPRVLILSEVIFVVGCNVGDCFYIYMSFGLSHTDENDILLIVLPLVRKSPYFKEIWRFR